MHRDPLGLGGRREARRQQRADRVGHRHMGHAAGPEERAFAPVRAVDELVDEHEEARRQLLAERAAGRDRNDVGHPGPLHGIDIGAVIDVGRREPVPAPVAGQEHDLGAADRARTAGVRWFTPRARHGLLAQVLRPGRS